MNNLASYGGYRSGGYPLVGNDGVLDLGKVQRLARYGTVVIHANALHLRPDIVAALRAAGAKRVIPYLTMTAWWLGAGFTPQASDTSLNAELQRLYLKTGAHFAYPQPGYEIDWENEAMARGYADLCAMLAGSGFYDGMFFDFASPDIMGNSERDAMRRENMNRVIGAVYEAGGESFDVVLNGIGMELMDGSAFMNEGFPQPFTSFDEALKLNYLHWLKCEDTSPRAGRFGYGTALLTGATFCWGPQRWQDFDGDRWLPEFDVDLGDARGAYLRHESGVYMRWFEKGLVIVNPTWSSVTVDLLARSHASENGQLVRLVTVPVMDARVMVRA